MKLYNELENIVKKYVAKPLIVGGLVAALTLTVLVKEARGKTYYINDPEEQNIQSVIDDPNVIHGDEIIVEEGRYYENINFNGKNITLRSTEPNNSDVVANTIIDGMQNGSVVSFYNGEGFNAPCVLSGFTITNGYWDFGGGISCEGSSPTFVNCVISSNHASWEGGGMYNNVADSTLINCTFSENHANLSGGGIYAWESTPTLINCKFIKNSAKREYGGGVYGDGGISLTNCIFSNNSAEIYGGGLCYSGNATLINCTFYGNSVSESGGGIYGRTEFYDVSLTNCIFWANKRDNNITDEAAQIYDRWKPTVNYCCVQGWTGTLGGIGNICADPLFSDPNNDDYHLKSQAGRCDPNTKTWTLDDVTSPCIDAGDPQSPIGYEPFPNGGRINMGAYGGTVEASKTYFGKPNCETIVAGDINGDCAVDFYDFTIMAGHWLEDRSEE